MRRAVAWPLVGPPVALLGAFGEIGARVAPPRPPPATWNQDEAGIARYQTATLQQFERRWRSRCARRTIS